MKSNARFSWRLRHPKRPWRILAVALAFALPGSLAGAMVAMFFGRPALMMCIGILSGALCGALLEARS